jgi:glycosyltransferase involved in cell wall biosynthesis
MSTTGPAGRPEVLFVNGGILGLVTFQHFLDAWLPRQSSIVGHRLLLTEGLTTSERIVRRLLCLRLWPDGLFGARNLDFARFRHELHAGLLARRRMRGRRFDVLHFHRQGTAYASLDLMRRVPAIVTMDCTQECVLADATTAVERATYRPNVRRDAAVFRLAHAIVATSRWAADGLRRAYPDCATPVHVMPDPVLLDRFDAGWIEARRARATARHVPRLLFIGGDFSRKGGYDLLDAWVAGRFHDRAELEVVTAAPLARPVPAGVRVTHGVTPHSAEWRALWAAADAFVMPTRNEAFGLVFQEAGAAGLPAIGTRHHAIPEIIIDRQTGLLVPPGDREALVRAMATLVDEPRLRDELGRNARRHIEATAAPDRYLAALVEIVLDARRSRRA